VASITTVADVRRYLGNQVGPGNPPNDAELAEALSTAQSRITERCIPLADPWPEVVERACTMLAARLYRRRHSVGGFEGFGDLGLVRVPALDPDIEDLLYRYLKYEFA
jgi:hypothetical protein